MGATFSTSDVGGIMSQVMEHQDANITELWNQDPDPLVTCYERQATTDGIGRAISTRVEIDTGASASSVFGIAQGIAQGTDLGSAALRGRWLSNAAKLEVVAVWDRDSMLAAVGDGPGEVIDVVSRERETKIALAKHLLGIQMAEAGWGRISTVSAISTGNLYFTVPKSEIQRFKYGMKIVFGQYEATGTLRGADGTGVYAGYGNPWEVSGVEPQTSTVYVSARSSDHPYDTDAVRANDTVFICGSRQNTASPAQICLKGLKSWIPSTAPVVGETSFEGLDRRNKWQLNGIRIDASVGNLDHISAFIEAGQMAGQFSTQLDMVLTSYEDIAIMARNKERVKIIPMNVGTYGLGFEGFEIQNGGGKAIKVVASRYLSQGTAWAGPFNSKQFGPKLRHNGKLINTDNADGLEYIRLASSAGFEQRMFFRGAGVIPGPGKYFCIFNLPSS